MAGQASGQTLMCGGIFDLANHQRVVAGDLIAGDSQIGLRRAGLLILECIAKEKAVERVAAAIEFIDLVTAFKLLNPERGH